MNKVKYLLMLLVLAMAVSAQAENFINNGSFETADTTDWWTEQTGTASVTIDDTMASIGDYSLLATSSGDNWAEEARFGQYFEFEASAEGDEITVYFDYYAVSAGLIGVNFDYYTDAKHWLGWTEITPVTGAWNTAEITYSLPTGTYALDLKIIVTGTAEIYFDKFTTDPYHITLNSPTNGQEVGKNVNFSWTLSPSVTVNTIDLYVGTENDPNLTQSSNRELTHEPNETTSYSLTLTPDTYFWKVVGYEPNALGGPDIPVDSAVWSFTVTEKPEITSMTPYAESLPGDGSVNATITAVGSNLDTCTIVWSKDGTELTDTVKYGGLGTEVLIVNEVAFPEDEGIYTCYASNGAGDTAANAVIVTERLISWWKLDGDLNDSVQEIVSGAPEFDGVVDPETEFTTDNSGIDGGNSVILDSDDPNSPFLQIDGTEEFFNFYQDSITINVWVRTSNVAWQGIFAKAPDGDTGPVVALDGEGEVLVQMDGEPGRLYADWAVADGQWHMVTMTYDGLEQRIYIDGELDTTTTGSSLISGIKASGNLAPVIIGAWDVSAENADFTGNIDNVKVYSKVLTTTEIGQEYVDTNPNAIYVCNWEKEWLQFDSNNNCKVDLPDFAAFADTWLNCNRIPETACDE